jgi:hypothetical protein
MDRERVEGAHQVAALLEQMAAGIELGDIPIGDRHILCHDDLAAIVEVPDVVDGGPLLINVRLAGSGSLGKSLVVEQELSHPGG